MSWHLGFGYPFGSFCTVLNPSTTLIYSKHKVLPNYSLTRESLFIIYIITRQDESIHDIKFSDLAQGDLSIRNSQNRSHFTLSQKRENHHRSRSHFPTPMTVLYKKWANDLGTKWPNWSTNFVRNYCEVIVRKGLKFLATLSLEDPPEWSNHRIKY